MQSLQVDDIVSIAFLGSIKELTDREPGASSLEASKQNQNK